MTKSEPAIEPGPGGLHIRGAAPTDQAFIASTWVGSLGLVDGPRPSHERGQLVDRVLDKTGVRVQVACETADPHHILGWLAHTPMPSATVIHYIYVRNQVRKRGIGSALALSIGLDQGRPVVYTVQGPSARWLQGRHPHATYLPVEDFLR